MFLGRCCCSILSLSWEATVDWTPWNRVIVLNPATRFSRSRVAKVPMQLRGYEHTWVARRPTLNWCNPQLHSRTATCDMLALVAQHSRPNIALSMSHLQAFSTYAIWELEQYCFHKRQSCWEIATLQQCHPYLLVESPYCREKINRPRHMSGTEVLLGALGK